MINYICCINYYMYCDMLYKNKKKKEKADFQDPFQE